MHYDNCDIRLHKIQNTLEYNQFQYFISDNLAKY